MVQRNNRYVVEQYLLPSALYNSGPTLLHWVLQNVNEVMSELYDDAEANHPGAVFSEMHRVYYRDDASALIIRIEMPEPEDALLSRAVYLCFNNKNGENLYLTSELAATGEYLLCCRPNSKYIMHMICSESPEDAQKEFDMVADQYWGMIFDGSLKQFESLRSR